MGFLETPCFFAETICFDLQQLTEPERFTLLCQFWPNSGLTIRDAHEKSYDAFIDYIGQELSSLRMHRTEFAAQTFEATADIIQIMLQNRHQSRAELVAKIGVSFLNLNNLAVVRSLELTLRLWLTVNVHSTQTALGPVHAGQSVLEWDSDQSLDALLGAHFKKSPATNRITVARIDPALTAAHLVERCDIMIDWTNNLVDHLRFDRKRRFLTVYRHKICLLNHAKSQQPTIIPLSILEETIDTLNLLFPFGDMATKSLLEREREPFYSLGNCGRDLQFDLARYEHWRDRLLDICEAFDEPPRRLKHLLSNRGNIMDYYAFWIAVFVLLLTIVSIIFGTVSTVFAIKQYNLALAQACSAPDAPTLMSQYCR